MLFSSRGDNKIVLEQMDYDKLSEIKDKVWKKIELWDAKKEVLQSEYIENKNKLCVFNTGSVNINPLILTMMVEESPGSQLLVSPNVNFRTVRVENFSKLNKQTKISLEDALYDSEKSDYLGVRQLVIFPYKIAVTIDYEVSAYNYVLNLYEIL